MVPTQQRVFYKAGDDGFKTRYLLNRESFIRLVNMGSKHGTYSIESFYEAGNDGFKTWYLLNRESFIMLVMMG